MGQVPNFCFLFCLLCWGCQWISHHLPATLLTVCCVMSPPVCHISAYTAACLLACLYGNSLVCFSTLMACICTTGLPLHHCHGSSHHQHSCHHHHHCHLSHHPYPGHDPMKQLQQTSYHFMANRILLLTPYLKSRICTYVFSLYIVLMNY
jgi:hypothetical protein